MAEQNLPKPLADEATQQHTPVPPDHGTESRVDTLVSPVLALRAAWVPELLGLVAVAADGRISEANETFLRLTGYSPDDLTSLRWDDVVPEEWRRGDAAARAQLSVSRAPVSWEHPCLRKDGTRVPLLIRAAADPAHPGQWLACVSDHSVTHGLAEALRDSEERFRLLVEHVGDAVFMLAADGRVVTWTLAAERLLGYDSREATALRTDDFYPAADRANGKPRADLERALLDGRHEVDAVRLGKNRVRLWAHVVTCPVYGPKGELRGFAQILQDRTTMRKAERQLQRKTRELQRSNEELERFASVAAHDLQEPLRKLRTFGDRLRRIIAPSTIASDSDLVLGRMDAAVDRMQALIEGLLAFARVARRSTRATSIDLGAMVDDVLGDLSTAIAASGAEIRVEPLPTLPADPLQIRQVFQNLLSNSLKFARADITPKIQLSARLDGDFWEILVADNGIGFDSKYRERIFELLQRLNGRSAYEGAGLGLAICRRVIERHGGTITADGVLGEGSRFTIRLPVSRDHAPHDDDDDFEDALE